MSDAHKSGNNKMIENSGSVNAQDSTAWDNAHAAYTMATPLDKAPFYAAVEKSESGGAVLGYEVEFSEGPYVYVAGRGMKEDTLIISHNDYEPELWACWDHGHYDYGLGYSGVISDTKSQMIESSDHLTRNVTSQGGARVAHVIEDDGASRFSMTKLTFGQNITTVTAIQEDSIETVVVKHETAYSVQLARFENGALAFAHKRKKPRDEVQTSVQAFVSRAVPTPALASPAPTA